MPPLSPCLETVPGSSPSLSFPPCSPCSRLLRAGGLSGSQQAWESFADAANTQQEIEPSLQSLFQTASLWGAVHEQGPAALSCLGRDWLHPSLKPHSWGTKHTELLVVSMKKALNVASSNQYFMTEHLSRRVDVVSEGERALVERKLISPWKSSISLLVMLIVISSTIYQVLFCATHSIYVISSP